MVNALENMMGKFIALKQNRKKGGMNKNGR